MEPTTPFLLAGAEAAKGKEDWYQSVVFCYGKDPRYPKHMRVRDPVSARPTCCLNDGSHKRDNLFLAQAKGNYLGGSSGVRALRTSVELSSSRCSSLRGCPTPLTSRTVFWDASTTSPLPSSCSSHFGMSTESRGK